MKPNAEQAAEHVTSQVDATIKDGTFRKQLAALAFVKGHHGVNSLVSVALLSLLAVCKPLTGRRAVSLFQQTRRIARTKCQQFGLDELATRLVRIDVTHLLEVLKEAKIEPDIPKQKSVADLMRLLIDANAIRDPDLRDDVQVTIETPAELQLYCNDNGCRIDVASLIEESSEQEAATSETDDADETPPAEPPAKSEAKATDESADTSPSKAASKARPKTVSKKP